MPKVIVTRYSWLLICAHGRIKSNQRTFCKTTVQLEAAMESTKNHHPNKNSIKANHKHTALFVTAKQVSALKDTDLFITAMAFS